MRAPTGRPSSEEVLSPLVVCWPHTQKEKNRQRKERKKEERKERKKRRPQLQPRFSNKNQQEQNSSVDQSSPERINNNNEDRGTRSSPLNRWLFEPNAARYHITKEQWPSSFHKNRTEHITITETCNVWCALLACSISLNANKAGTKEKKETEQQPDDLGRKPSGRGGG